MITLIRKKPSWSEGLNIGANDSRPSIALVHFGQKFVPGDLNFVCQNPMSFIPKLSNEFPVI
jgi:hypothetical protein